MNIEAQKSWVRKHPIWTVFGVIFLIGWISSLTKDPAPSTVSNNAEEVKTEPVSTSTATSATVQSVKQSVSAPAPTVTQKATVPAEYKSALNKASSYANVMHMSKRAVYDQLVSEYGEKFSPAAAQYAIDNVKADWYANALAKAKSYQDRMSMSPAAIRDQLISEHGERFTQAEADYAIQHLND